MKPTRGSGPAHLDAFDIEKFYVPIETFYLHGTIFRVYFHHTNQNRTAGMIYKDGNYRIEQTGPAMATVTNGAKVVQVRLEAPRPMPARAAAAMRKAGMAPAEYFFAGGAVLRCAAKASWGAAVAAVDLRNDAHKAAHAEATRIGAEVEAEREMADDGTGHPTLYLLMVRPNGTAYTRKAGI